MAVTASKMVFNRSGNGRPLAVWMQPLATWRLRGPSRSMMP